MKRITRYIPNTLTVLSLFAGFLSVLFSIQALSDLYLVSLKKTVYSESLPEEFLALAGLSILLASILDFLDGLSARLFNAYSNLGKQLDSLADFVSFGLAPGVLFFTVTLIAVDRIPDTGLPYILEDSLATLFYGKLFFLKVLAFIFPVCTLFRLAKFNLNTKKKNYFEGLPSTYAGAIISLTLTFNFYLTPWAKLFQGLGLTIPEEILFMVKPVNWIFFNYFFLTLMYLLVSFLMISHIRFYRLDFILKKYMNKKIIPLFLAIGILSVLFFKYIFILISFGYMLVSLVYHFVSKKNKETS